jgi:hypothetical protein
MHGFVFMNLLESFSKPILLRNRNRISIYVFYDLLAICRKRPVRVRSSRTHRGHQTYSDFVTGALEIARITLFGGGSRCGNLALSAAISSLDCCCSTVVTVMTFVTLGA